MEAAPGLSRRDFLERSCALAAGLSLSGHVLAACGTSYPIAWQPDVFRPVFYGWDDLTPERGAPGNVRVWYPSLEGSPAHAPILSPSRGRFPLVLFLHGQCSQESATHYQTAWVLLPAQLARSGYVVAVPQLAHGGYPWTSSEVTLATDIAGWIRSSWWGSDQLMPSPATAVIGHSYGGMLAARIAASAPDAAQAYVSIGAPWSDWSVADAPLPLPQLRQPALFLWAGDDTLADMAPFFNTVPVPKHEIKLVGGTHWDHAREIPSKTFGCDQDGPGACRLIAVLTADFTAVFVAKYLRPDGASSDPAIGDDLVPPTVGLTQDQQFYAGAHLSGIRQLPAAAPCGVTRKWSTADGSNTTSSWP